MTDESNSFLKFAKAARPGIDAALEASLPEESGPAAGMHKAMRYSVLNGGKRLRPALCLAACRAFGGSVESVMPVCCALEIVHAFTLVHDDLPCMDDDELRRGRPTAHKVFGEGLAMLAGDALHNLSYRILMRHCIANFPQNTAAMVVEAFSSAVYKVCEGQWVDLEAEGKAPDADALRFIHDNKTAALIWAAVICGALSADAPAHDVARLSEFADASGLLFQNVDDILDAVGEKEVTGKSGPADERKKKLTTVRGMGLEAAAALAAKQKDLATYALSGMDNVKILGAFPEYIYLRIPEWLK